MTKINKAVSIFWFRRDLRLEDNVGLYHALQSGCPVLPLFIFDTDILSQLEDKYDRRVDFIHQVLTKLQTSLIAAGSSLYVKTGKPIEVFEKLNREFDVKAVYTNRDYEPYALKRDGEVKGYLQSKSIDFIDFKDQVIFEQSEVVKANGEPYTVFTPYSRVWKQKLTDKDYHHYPSEKSLDLFFQIDKCSIPDLEDIGFSKTAVLFQPPLIEENIIQSYEETRNFPAIKGTTGLSVHLRFGTISIRREFFMSILFHFPYVVNGPFKKKYEAIAWRNNEAEFALWCEGKTGYPIVDAGMRELNETGWMHNRVRMIVASFLTKHLLIEWRWGEAYFAVKLLDYELSSNNGNWQWAAGCGCDAAPYFRVFNPTEQTKRFDPELKYIHQWVKELDSFTYPQPIVEHAFARNRALETYKRSMNFSEE